MMLLVQLTVTTGHSLQLTGHSPWFLTMPSVRNTKRLVTLSIVHNKFDWLAFQALKTAQIKVGQLQDQVKQLLLKNSELRAKVKGKSTQAAGSRKVLSGDEKLIAQYAKKFGVMNEMFMPPGALAVKRPLTTSMHSGRYESDLAELEGMIAEVYESLPENLHDDMENSIAFRNLVNIFCNQAFHYQSLLEFILSSSDSSIQIEGVSSISFELVQQLKYLAIRLSTTGFNTIERPSPNSRHC